MYIQSTTDSSVITAYGSERDMHRALVKCNNWHPDLAEMAVRSVRDFGRFVHMQTNTDGDHVVIELARE